jgi:hypothetical protein
LSTKKAVSATAFSFAIFKKISSDLLTKLNYAYNVLIFDYINQELNSKDNNPKNSNSNVIDVDISEN